MFFATGQPFLRRSAQYRRIRSAAAFFFSGVQEAALLLAAALILSALEVALAGFLPGRLPRRGAAGAGAGAAAAALLAGAEVRPLLPLFFERAVSSAAIFFSMSAAS